MESHLNAEQLEQFRAKIAGPGELLAMDRHLAECSDCRSRLRAARPLDEVWNRLIGIEEPEHLTHDQIAAYVDWLVDDIDREIVASHTSLCEECAYVLRKLERLSQVVVLPLEQTAKKSLWEKLQAFFHSYAIQLAAAGAVAIVAMAVVVSRPDIVGRAPLLAGFASRLARTLHVEKSSVLPVPEEYRDFVQEMLRESEWPLPPQLIQVLKDPQTSQPFRLETPAASVELRNPPSFRWQPLPGALSYQVDIFDRLGAKVLSSPRLTTTQWTPPTVLDFGKVFRWRVAASLPGQEVSSPATPPPGGVAFALLTAEQAKELDSVHKQYPDSHLLLGLLYTRDGAFSEAQQEFESLQRQMPDSSVSKQLLAKLADVRSRAKRSQEMRDLIAQFGSAE